jgi:hypothetical protein
MKISTDQKKDATGTFDAGLIAAFCDPKPVFAGGRDSATASGDRCTTASNFAGIPGHPFLVSFDIYLMVLNCFLFRSWLQSMQGIPAGGIRWQEKLSRFSGTQAGILRFSIILRINANRHWVQTGLKMQRMCQRNQKIPRFRDCVCKVLKVKFLKNIRRRYQKQEGKNPEQIGFLK